MDDGAFCSFVSLQLPLFPMNIFATGIEHARDAAVQRSQHANSGMQERPLPQP
jgi:hypothetical protein